MCVYKVIVAGDYVDADANMCIYKIIVADDYGDADVIYKIIVAMPMCAYIGYMIRN